MNISEQLSKLTIIQSPNMKPFPYQQVNAIEHEMCDLRDEVSKLRVQLENAQNCLNALYRKRQELITPCSFCTTWINSCSVLRFLIEYEGTKFQHEDHTVHVRLRRLLFQEKVSCLEIE